MTIEMLASNTLPPGVDQMHIDAGGTLRIGSGGGLVEFGFRFMDIPFTANTRRIQSGPIVQISGEIAPLPYSAEGIVVRRSAIAIIDASQDLAHTRLAVSKHKTILCVGKAPLTDPWTPVDLIAASASVILEVRPFLQLLAEILPTWPKPPTAD
ncbi:hypothetical protein [Dongia mobilis]|uniref:hypothetical protein n=1 Tax=Dongia sp. TaxID=1977262 RepID=UPI0026E97B80